MLGPGVVDGGADAKEKRKTRKRKKEKKPNGKTVEKKIIHNQHISAKVICNLSYEYNMRLHTKRASNINSEYIYVQWWNI